ncbi:TetR family transcriptional regulator [Candidatus Saccharibacteria bacterium]|nr:TetR family transcriptional regulator [Candidatus Saccharibacteria bacterium]
MEKSKYTRVTEKNRRKIQEAFAELLAERGSLSNITVTDLAERAEITRGTFYNYYNNLYEVGAELQAELEKRLFSEYDNLATLEGIEQYIDEVFNFFEKQEGIYRELLASDASIDFLTQLENSMSQRVLSVLHKNGVTDKSAELELLFTTNGAIAIVRKHYRGEIRLSLDDIRDYLKAKIGWMFRKYVAQS